VEQGRFDKRLSNVLSRLSPAELRVARNIAQRKDRVLLASAAQIAEMAGTSDATLVRMVRTLGYDALAEMREDLLADLTGGTTPATRMQHSIEAAGTEPARLLEHVIGIQEDQLKALRMPAIAQQFGIAIDLLSQAATCHVFGLGPSGAMADYLALQLTRVGLPGRALTRSGIGLADQLLAFRPGDVVMVIAYAPLYREVSVVLDRAEAMALPVLLISDSLRPLLETPVACALDVPRGRSEHLALHSATLVVIEALILGLSARNRDHALDALDDFATLRAAIDGAWTKRGTRRRKTPQSPRAAEMPPSP